MGSGRLARVLGPALGLVAAGLVGAALEAAGASKPAPSLAFTLAGLALLALAVALNALLRMEGVGGEGLMGAAGVLGAALVLVSRAIPSLGAVLDARPASASPAGELLRPLELGGWLLTAVWLARSGWSLRLLLAPSSLLGWSSVAAAGATAALALLGLAAGGGGRPSPAVETLEFLPLVLWSATLVVVGALGRPVTDEPREE